MLIKYEHNLAPLPVCVTTPLHYIVTYIFYLLITVHDENLYLNNMVSKHNYIAHTYSVIVGVPTSYSLT